MENSPLIGVGVCCIVPMIWTVGMFALGVWYERNGGLPWELRRRERLHDD
jgi:hypothetical protein